jgi:hypothetical protein
VAALSVVGLVLVPAPQASAAPTTVAVLGDNGIDDLLTTSGMQVALVSDAQVATPGFLDDFDVFVYTRNGSGTGAALSAAAAANVKAYVHRTVLLNGDFADAIGADTEIEELITNSVAWAGATGHGYVGEFNGAFAGLTSNGSSLTPLGLIPGAASAFTSGADYGTIAATTPGTGHPVLAGVALPRDPTGMEIGSQVTGVDTHRVLARYSSNNNPAVLVRDLDATRVAEFGDNNIDDLLAGTFDVTIVTDAQLSTPGFLDGFDVFVYTRNGSGVGTALSEAAAANVAAFVRRVVLLNGDFADAIGVDVEIEQLIVGSVAWAGRTGHGYVGEFNGAFAGLSSVGNSLRPLGLITGSAAPFNSGADYGNIAATTAGTGHPVLAGVALPRDPTGVEIGSQMTGVDPAYVLARYSSNNNPAVIGGVRPVTATPTVSPTTGPVSPSSSTSPVIRGTAEAGSTVTLYANGTCTGAALGTGPAAAFAAPGITATVPANATTTIFAKATKAGSVDSACSTTSATYVQRPPDTTLTKTPKKKVTTAKSKAKVSFEFSSATAGATFQCSVDGQSFTACTSGAKLKLKAGRHTFAVRAVASGQTDPTPATYSFKIKRKR